MSNPFVYGEIVPDEAFVDREAELDRLITDLGGGQKVFLISPRRYGKSSLIRQALGGLRRRGALTVDVTVSSYSSYVAFLEGYARALAEVETRLDRARTWLLEAITATRPEIRYEPKDTGLSRFSVAFPAVSATRDVNRLAAEVFELPGRLADERKRPVVVALDEFQAIGAFNGGKVEHGLRAAAQRQRRVGYVFAGSEPSLMERMIGPRRPFYKAGPVMRLQKIPSEIFAEFLEARFAVSGMRAEPGLGAAIVDLAANLPYDVQRLAHETWDDVRADGRSRAPARHARAAARRTDHDVRSDVAASHARPACDPEGHRAARRPRTAVRRHPRAIPAGRPLNRPGIALRARQTGRAGEGRAALRGGGLVAAGVGGEENVLILVGFRLRALRQSGLGLKA